MIFAYVALNVFFRSSFLPLTAWLLGTLWAICTKSLHNPLSTRWPPLIWALVSSKSFSYTAHGKKKRVHHFNWTHFMHTRAHAQGALAQIIALILFITRMRTIAHVRKKMFLQTRSRLMRFFVFQSMGTKSDSAQAWDNGNNAEENRQSLHRGAARASRLHFRYRLPQVVKDIKMKVTIKRMRHRKNV